MKLHHNDGRKDRNATDGATISGGMREIIDSFGGDFIQGSQAQVPVGSIYAIFIEHTVSAQISGRPTTICFGIGIFKSHQSLIDAFTKLVSKYSQLFTFSIMDYSKTGGRLPDLRLVKNDPLDP